MQPLLTFTPSGICSDCSPKKNKSRVLVSSHASGVGRESSQRETAVLRQKIVNQTPVGGNELNAVCRASAAYRGAPSHENKPTMSVYDPASEDYRVLTVKEVAAHFRVCRRTIEREIASGRFPRPLKIGRSLRFAEADLRTYVAKLKGESASPLPQ
jgi:excisionase family DNA binding protein